MIAALRSLLQLYLILNSIYCCSSFLNSRVVLSSKQSYCALISRTFALSSDSRTFGQESKDVDDKFIISNVGLGDMYDVIRLANDQFLKSTDTVIDVIKLDVAILNLFLPKLLMPEVMKHSVIGVRSASNNVLVGFVDLSLQMSTGSLDALKPKTLAERSKLYGNSLAPYLCNLFVSPTLRKRGLARRLIAACEAEARSWGCNTINLHVELSSPPALNLYLSSNFKIILTAQDDVVFMTKTLT